MQRESWTWTSTRLSAPARVTRWGHFGTPILLFGSAGGDFEEVERFHLIGALGELIKAGRIKVFSVDGLAARAWLRGTHSPEHCAHVQGLFDAYIDTEVVPLIRRDCQSDTIEVIAAGAALGAYNAVSALRRMPGVFRVAVGLSGVYDPSKYLTSGFTPALRAVSLEGLGESPDLERMRSRFVVLATGEGDYETPADSRRMASALESARVPARLDMWGPAFAHSWSTWHAMLPRYLATHA
jgi:esterase/lipase superfamily enzyme